MSDDASAVVVGGLPVTVRVTAADPLLDRLAVHGLAGADTITATGAPGDLNPAPVRAVGRTRGTPTGGVYGSCLYSAVRWRP